LREVTFAIIGDKIIVCVVTVYKVAQNKPQPNCKKNRFKLY